jgi:hypothetical protein
MTRCPVFEIAYQSGQAPHEAQPRREEEGVASASSKVRGSFPRSYSNAKSNEGSARAGNLRPWARTSG